MFSYSPSDLSNTLGETNSQMSKNVTLSTHTGEPAGGRLQRARAALLDALQRRLRRRHQGRGRQGRRRTLHPELHAQHIHRCKSLPAFLLLMLFFFSVLFSFLPQNG